MKDAYFDRFDIVTAYYLFFAHYHEGQNSGMYARLSKILTYFNPGLGVQNNMMNENTQAIYDNLVKREEATRLKIAAAQEERPRSEWFPPPNANG